MRVFLSEVLTTEYAISTPFQALLGRLPVQVYAVLERTVVLQIIGEDDRRVIRHDIITVDPERLRARPSPKVDQLQKAREKGRENSHKNGIEEPITDSEIQHFHQIKGAKFDPMEKLAQRATHVSS